MAHGSPRAWLRELRVGMRLFVQGAPPDARWQERLLLAKRSLEVWAVARPAGAVALEDLTLFAAVGVVGPRGGLPRACRGEPLLRFDAAEIAAREAELRVEGAALVAAEAAIPPHARRIPRKMDQAALGDVPPAPVLPLAEDQPRAGGRQSARPAAAHSVEDWVAAEDREGIEIGDTLPPSAVVQVTFDDRGVARLRSGTAIAIGKLGTVSRPTPRVERVAAVDARILPVLHLVGGVRGRVFGETIRLLTETPAADWSITGPRTARWLVQAIAAQGYTPLQWHYWWRNVQALSAADAFVDDHLFISELLETGIVYDQLNIGEVAIFETVARRYQLYEEFYSNALRVADGGPGADQHLDERQLFLGQDRGRGRALVCPALEAWVAGRMQSEAAILKERRKGREERVLAGASAEHVVYIAQRPGEEQPAAGAAAGGGRGRGGRGGRR